MNLAPEFEGVLPPSIGNVVDKLEPRVGPLNLRPDKPAQRIGRDELGEGDQRQSAKQWIRDAGVESVGGRRDGVIRGERRLVEPVVSETGFIDPMRTWNVGPIHAEDLRASVNEGQPNRLHFLRVIHGPGVVAEEVSAADGVAVVDAVIDLAYGIVGIDDVWESDSHEPRGRGLIVERKA